MLRPIHPFVIFPLCWVRQTSRIHNVGHCLSGIEGLLSGRLHSVLRQPWFKTPNNRPDKRGPCWRWQINEAPLFRSILSIIRLSWWRVQSWVPGGCTQNTYEELCTEGRRWRSSHQERLRSACEPRRQGWIEWVEQSQHAPGGTVLLCVLETHREAEVDPFVWAEQLVI